MYKPRLHFVQRNYFLLAMCYGYKSECGLFKPLNQTVCVQQHLKQQQQQQQQQTELKEKDSSGTVSETASLYCMK